MTECTHLNQVKNVKPHTHGFEECHREDGNMHTPSPKDPESVPKPSIRTITSRENGSLGGDARASRNDHAVIQEWSSRGGKKLREKYGHEYFVELRKKRKYYPSFWQSPITRRKPNHRGHSSNAVPHGTLAATRTAEKSHCTH